MFITVNTAVTVIAVGMYSTFAIMLLTVSSAFLLMHLVSSRVVKTNGKKT